MRIPLNTNDSLQRWISVSICLELCCQQYMIGIWVDIIFKSRSPHKDAKLLYMKVS